MIRTSKVTEDYINPLFKLYSSLKANSSIYEFLLQEFV
jgi:hypothetical protein